MMISLAVRRVGLVLLGCLCLAGCSPFFDNGLEEEKNPLITDARAKKAAYNYDGAIAALEKALEANPRVALAHWELGLIYYQNVNDHAAAIYHFNKLLKLRPDWKQADTTKRFIEVCRMELAKTAPLGPQPPRVQQEIDKLVAKQLELTRENTQLKERHQALQIQAQQLALENSQLKQASRVAPALVLESPNLPRPPTPPPTTAPRAAAPAANTASRQPPAGGSPVATQPRPPVSVARPPIVGAARPSPSAQASSPATVPRTVNAAVPTPASKPRTHTVRSGDTAAAIARQYNLKLTDVLAANPGLEPSRLRVGQVVRLPIR